MNNERCNCHTCVQFGLSRHPTEEIAMAEAIVQAEHDSTCQECDNDYSACTCDQPKCGLLDGDICGIGGCPECDPNHDRCRDCDEYKDECVCEDAYDQAVETQKVEDARIKEKWKVLDSWINPIVTPKTIYVDFKTRKVTRTETN